MEQVVEEMGSGCTSDKLRKNYHNAKTLLPSPGYDYLSLAQNNPQSISQNHKDHHQGQLSISIADEPNHNPIDAAIMCKPTFTHLYSPIQSSY